MATSKSIVTISTVAGNFALVSYASDGGFEAAKGSAAASGDAYWNSTLSVARFYDGSNWTSVLADKLNSPTLLQNYSLSCSVGSSALTIALKTSAGANATSTTPIYMAFRSATLTSGTSNIRSCTAATSVVVSSGSTLGHSDAVEQYIYVYALDNSGTIELAVSSGFLDEGTVVTTTAEGGAGAADSATTVYSTTARTSVPLRLIGRLKSTQTTAGTWAAVPTEVSLPPFRIQKQVETGTPVTSTGTTTSATFAALGSNNPSITFTPRRTGLYKVYATLHSSNSAAGNTNTARIIASSGTPSVVFSQESTADTAINNATVTLAPYTIVKLAAGSAYTFRAEFKTGGGTLTLQSAAPTNGHALVAEEL